MIFKMGNAGPQRLQPQRQPQARPMPPQRRPMPQPPGRQMQRQGQVQPMPPFGAMTPAVQRELAALRQRVAALEQMNEMMASSLNRLGERVVYVAPPQGAQPFPPAGPPPSVRRQPPPGRGAAINGPSPALDLDTPAYEPSRIEYSAGGKPMDTTWLDEVGGRGVDSEGFGD